MARKKERELAVNRIQTPDGTILISKYSHDYVGYTDKNGEYYFVDGGMDYSRTSVNKEPAKNLCLFMDDDFEELRKYVYRGCYTGEWKPICELSNEHLKNILIYNKENGFGGGKQEKLIKKEIKYRKEHGILIEDNWKGDNDDDCGDELNNMKRKAENSK
jgi:hypothetical protein